MVDYIEAIRRESARFLRMIESTSMDAPVPSCPGWTMADLAWHLAEVQNFWAQISGHLLSNPEEVASLDRPRGGDLAVSFAKASERLLAGVTRHPADAVCWSWYEGGRSVGWVRRRQAHEALIHRVDAELAAGAVSGVDGELAADGVDEMLGVMLGVDPVPGWAEYLPDGTTARIDLTDGERSWSFDLGRFVGSESGAQHDLPALRLVEHLADPDSIIRGAAASLDLWLWGRSSPDELEVRGDRSMVDRLRSIAADASG